MFRWQKKLGIPFVISGFEGEQLLLTIYLLIKERNHGIVRNVYLSAVTKSGNALAKRMVGKYFKNVTLHGAEWEL